MLNLNITFFSIVSNTVPNSTSVKKIFNICLEIIKSKIII